MKTYSIVKYGAFVASNRDINLAEYGGLGSIKSDNYRCKVPVLYPEQIQINTVQIQIIYICRFN